MIPKAIEKVRRRGGRVIVVDPRAGRFVSAADLHLALRPGTDSIVANGLLRAVAALGFVDEHFVSKRTVGFGDALEAADPWTPGRVEAATGVPSALLLEAASLLGQAERAMILHARGAEQQVSGTQNVLAYINVALACGHAGRRGSGILPLTGQRNGQGGREHGQRCDQLPGARNIEDPEHRQAVATIWGVEPESLPGRGMSYVEIMSASAEGRIGGLLALSTNPAVSSPDLAKVRQALSRLEHLVVIDPFLSETAALADVVLPGATFAEEEGTITTLEGRVVRVDAAVAPWPGRGDIDVLRNLANRLGSGTRLSFVNGREVFEELRRVTAGAPADYSGMTWDAIRERGGIFWPCPHEGHEGTPRLFLERFAHPDGRARFHADRSVEPTGPGRRDVPAGPHHRASARPLPIGQPDAPDPRTGRQGARVRVGGAPRHGVGPGPAAGPPRGAGESPRFGGGGVAGAPGAANRHGVPAVPLAAGERADRGRPGSDRPHPRLEVHARATLAGASGFPGHGPGQCREDVPRRRSSPRASQAGTSR